MKSKRLAAVIAGAAGAAAVGNQLISQNTEPLSPPLERETGTYRWRGMNISYTEGGDPEAPDMLLVHDLHRAGTSREFNRIFERLAESYHVFAPDLPGFGRSSRPSLTYSATLFETFLEDFIKDLTDRPIGISSGLSSAYLISAAQQVDLAELILICPTAEAATRNNRIASGILRAPLLGPATFNLLTSRRAIQRFGRTQAYYDVNALSEHDETYLWQTAHQPGARYPIASMQAGHLDSEMNIGITLATLDLETCLIWGRAATSPPLRIGREIADRADLKLIVLDQARSLPHVEQAGPFLETLAKELEVTS